MDRRRARTAAWFLWLSAAPLLAAEIPVPNGAFGEGRNRPAGWVLSGGRGSWDAEDGNRFLTVTGTGSDDNAWLSPPLPFAPSTLYRLGFRARSRGAEGGTPISGPGFCNRDLGSIPTTWTDVSSVFVSPAAPDADGARLRFGQWRVRGTLAFDDAVIFEAQAVYDGEGDLVLGEGERVEGTKYAFDAPFRSASRNHARPLDSHRCRFNTDRWVFAPGSEVIYRHRVGVRALREAAVEPAVTWHRRGRLEAACSADGEAWTVLGALEGEGSRSFPLPPRVLSSGDVRIRLRAPEGEPCALQLGAYAFRATLDGAPARITGRTRFVDLRALDPRASVQVTSLGDGVPGGRNDVVLQVANPSDRPLRCRGRVKVTGLQTGTLSFAADVTIPPGGGEGRIPYRIRETGPARLRITLEGDAVFDGEARWIVADLHGGAYGETLPGSSADAALWWASSGWKVSRTRPPPDASGPAVVVRAARNEAEAAQVIVRPARAIRGFTAGCTALRGPGGAVLPPSAVDLLRVRYVDVRHPTDATGVAAPWPDPLPPFRGPVDLEAGVNHPLWIRVTVPRDAAAGVYEGAVTLSGEGFEAQVPLRVEVFGFTLPDRMTCTTAFGFSPGLVWHYQKLREPAQRRAVLEKYWDSFAAHHIAPYDPAPLDPFETSWPASDWEGGVRDEAVKRSGASALRLEDGSRSAQASARYGPKIPIPEKGFVLDLWHRAAKGHAFIVTLNHHDAGGSWMPGRNRDMAVTGTGDWALFRREVAEFPEGAASVGLTLWAAPWAEDGSPTGTVWYDDVRLLDAGTGEDRIRAGGFEPLRPEDLAPVLSWERWDAAMERAMARGFTSFRVPVPGLGGGTFHARRAPSLLGYAEDAPEYAAAMKNWLSAVEGHLREKGWLDRAYVYWFDEPEPKDYAFVMGGFSKLARWAPGLGRMLTEQVEDALVGGPNIWCPVTPAYDHARAEARRARGERFWWYVCTGPKAPYCTLFIDHPATELRVWLWQTWKRRIEGVLVWQTNYWTSPSAYPDPAEVQNPYEDPMGWMSGYDTPAGARRPWGNGDGRFLYPPEAAAKGRPEGPVLDGPVDSIRWEMLRDGIEDYEYLALLSRALERKRASLTAGEGFAYERLLEVPAGISESLTSFTKDPAPIEARRVEIARAIEALSKE